MHRTHGRQVCVGLSGVFFFFSGGIHPTYVCLSHVSFDNLERSNL